MNQFIKKNPSIYNAWCRDNGANPKKLNKSQRRKFIKDMGSSIGGNPSRILKPELDIKCSMTKDIRKYCTCGRCELARRLYAKLDK